MSNVERDVILNQKLDQLKTKLKEAEVWTKILRTESRKDMGQFTNEFIKITEEWIDFINMISNKFDEFWKRRGQIDRIPAEFFPDNIPMGVYHEFMRDNFNRPRILGYLARSHQIIVANIRGSIQLLKGPNVTLEQIQAVTVPDFDWAKNNYNPSDFDLEVFKEKTDKVREAITKHMNAIEGALGEPLKVEETSGGNDEAEEVGADLQNE